MPPGSAETPVLFTRVQAIAALRRRLERLGDGEHSTCHVAAKRGIFCRGFGRWNDHEFHRRWAPVLGASTHLRRGQIERLADVWELCEQVACRVRVTCDARAASPGPCRGWLEFSDTELAHFCAELLDRHVVIASNGFDTTASASAMHGMPDTTSHS